MLAGGALLQCIDRVNAWVLTELTSLNQDILARRRAPGDLGAELARSVLADLPPPELLTPGQAQQLVVLLGLAGASLSRHYQELGRDHRATPEAAPGLPLIRKPFDAATLLQHLHDTLDGRPG